MRGRKAAPIEGLEQYNFLKMAGSKGTARERRRFLAFAHIQDGRSLSEAARMIKVAPRTVIVWVSKFRKFGIDGLMEKPGRGNKPLFAREKYEEFRHSVEQLQRSRPGGRITGKDVSKMLERQYQLRLSKSSVYNLLKRSGLVWIIGRSQHPKANPSAQAAFKKTSGRRSYKRSRRVSP